MSRNRYRALELHALHRNASTAVSLDAGPSVVERILPHRPPFRFVDSLHSIDLSQGTLTGQRVVDEDDPIFAGHFPGDPVYPAVLLAESAGQLAACLLWFLLHDATKIPSSATPIGVRATQIHHARFLLPVGPGDQLTLHARVEALDSLSATSVGQVYRGDALCAVASFEVSHAGA